MPALPRDVARIHRVAVERVACTITPPMCFIHRSGPHWRRGGGLSPIFPCGPITGCWTGPRLRTDSTRRLMSTYVASREFRWPFRRRSCAGRGHRHWASLTRNSPVSFNLNLPVLRRLHPASRPHRQRHSDGVAPGTECHSGSRGSLHSPSPCAFYE